MSPTMEEVAGWLREAQEEINNLVVFSGNYPSEKQVFNDRAAQVEAMGLPKTCDTCRWWMSQGGPWNSDYCAAMPNRIVPGQGPKFGCIHHKMKLQLPVKK